MTEQLVTPVDPRPLEVSENLIELEVISICPDCGSRLFEVVETASSNGPYCRCHQCKWEGKELVAKFCAEAKASEELDAVELIAIKKALTHYANHAPLDLKKLNVIQHDLRAILGEKHIHAAGIGTDACDLCGRDLRNDIHERSA